VLVLLLTLVKGKVHSGMLPRFLKTTKAVQIAPAEKYFADYLDCFLEDINKKQKW